MTVLRSGSSEKSGIYSSEVDAVGRNNFVGGVDMVGAGAGSPVGVVKDGPMDQTWLGGEKGG